MTVINLQGLQRLQNHCPFVEQLYTTGEEENPPKISSMSAVLVPLVQREIIPAPAAGCTSVLLGGFKDLLTPSSHIPSAEGGAQPSFVTIIGCWQGGGRVCV